MTDNTHAPTHGHVSRRTTLKAGAHAAWTVPVISIATAVPAHAASGDVSLVLDDVHAEYTADGTGARADQLTTQLALRSTGTTPATDLTFTLLVPAGLYATAPTIINAPSTWVPLSDGVGSLEDGWQISWFRSGDLGQGETTGTEPDPFRVQFTDPLTEFPYRRWQAEPFTAGLLVTALNLPTSVVGSCDVAIGPPAEFPVEEYGGSYVDQFVTLYGLVRNFGRSSSGAVTLRFWWNPEAGDPAWGQAPVAVSSPQLGAGVVSGGGTGPGDPWYVTFADGHGPTATRASYELDATPEELATTEIRFDVYLTLAAAPDHPRDFYMTVQSPDSAAPVAGTGPGWRSTLVDQAVIDVRPDAGRS